MTTSIGSKRQKIEQERDYKGNKFQRWETGKRNMLKAKREREKYYLLKIMKSYSFRYIFWYRHFCLL